MYKLTMHLNQRVWQQCNVFLCFFSQPLLSATKNFLEQEKTRFFCGLLYLTKEVVCDSNRSVAESRFEKVYKRTGQGWAVNLVWTERSRGPCIQVCHPEPGLFLVCVLGWVTSSLYILECSALQPYSYLLWGIWEISGQRLKPHGWEFPGNIAAIHSLAGLYFSWSEKKKRNKTEWLPWPQTWVSTFPSSLLWSFFLKATVLDHVSGAQRKKTTECHFFFFFGHATQHVGS